MYKLLVFVCLIALPACAPKPAPKPGLVYSAYTAPLAAAYTAPVAYSAPIAYSAYTAPVAAYSAYTYASPYSTYLLR